MAAFDSRSFAVTAFSAAAFSMPTDAEIAAADSGDISRAFAVDYSPLHLTPYEIAARRRFLQKIINDIAAAKKKAKDDEELAILALYAMLPKAA